MIKLYTFLEHNSGLWIGLRNSNNTSFKWSDGSDLTVLHWSAKMARKQPFDLLDCVFIEEYIEEDPGYWGVDICNNKRPFVCKTKFMTADIIATSAPTGCAQGMVNWRERCYWLTDDANDVSKSMQKCSEKGGQLLHIRNLSELYFITSLIYGRQKKFWTGLHQNRTIGLLEWSNYEPLTISSRQLNFKNKHIKGAKCVYISVSDGAHYMSLAKCSETLNAICNAFWGDHTPVKGIGYKVTWKKYTEIKTSCVYISPRNRGLTRSGLRLNRAPCGARRSFMCSVPYLIPCPDKRDNWYSFNGYCYYSSHLDTMQLRTKGWESARSFCKDNGGDLVSIHSDYDTDFILKLVFRNAKTIRNRVHFWIGSKRSNFGGMFKWSDGSAMNYLYWDNHHPSYYEIEACASLSPYNGFWIDNACNNQLHYICQRFPGAELQKTKEPVSINGSCLTSWTPYGNKCFKLFNTRKNYRKALDYCRSLGPMYDLASVKNKMEDNFFKLLSGSSNYGAWIGLSSSDQGTQFRWSDNSEVTYSMVAPLEIYSRSFDDGSICVNLVQGFERWNRSPCAASRSYICQGYKDPSLTELKKNGTCLRKNSYQFLNGCYEFVTGKQNRKSWDAAQKYCAETGGNLVSVLSKEEMLFITLTFHKFLNHNESEKYWLGLVETALGNIFNRNLGTNQGESSYAGDIEAYDLENMFGLKDHWEALEEEEIIDRKESAEGRTPNLPYSKSMVINAPISQAEAQKAIHWYDGWPIGFSYWDQDVATGFQGNLCLEIASYDSRWVLNTCRTLNNFICKVTTDKVPKFKTAVEGKCPHKAGVQFIDIGTSFCYTKHYKMDWALAEMECIRLGGHIASIHSLEEAMLLASYMEKSIYIWLGLYTDDERTMRWSDGSPVDFLNYHVSTKHDNSPREGMCTAMDTNTLAMFKRYCSNENEFFCGFNKIPSNETKAKRLQTTDSQSIHSSNVVVYAGVIGLVVVHYGPGKKESPVPKICPPSMRPNSRRTSSGGSKSSRQSSATASSSSIQMCRICHEGDICEDLLSPCICKEGLGKSLGSGWAHFPDDVLRIDISSLDYRICEVSAKIFFGLFYLKLIV
ncbi:Macrophage mannose receptor 1 [Nymphon striatum]|nr:Macrophage mannose receptor 1 [Nymphon striatum]